MTKRLIHGQTRGFTLVELLLVIAISVIMLSAGAGLLGGFLQTSQRGSAMSELVQTLRSARVRSVSAKGGTIHGVAIFPSQYVLFQGASYASRESIMDQVTVIPASFSLTTTLINQEITFRSPSGQASASGTITLLHPVFGDYTISINELGIVEFP